MMNDRQNSGFPGSCIDVKKMRPLRIDDDNDDDDDRDDAIYFTRACGRFSRGVHVQVQGRIRRMADQYQRGRPVYVWIRASEPQLEDSCTAALH